MEIKRESINELEYLEKLYKLHDSAHVYIDYMEEIRNDDKPQPIAILLKDYNIALDGGSLHLLIDQLDKVKTDISFLANTCFQQVFKIKTELDKITSQIDGVLAIQKYGITDEKSLSDTGIKESEILFTLYQEYLNDFDYLYSLQEYCRLFEIEIMRARTILTMLICIHGAGNMTKIHEEIIKLGNLDSIDDKNASYIYKYGE